MSNILNVVVVCGRSSSDVNFGKNAVNAMISARFIQIAALVAAASAVITEDADTLLATSFFPAENATGVCLVVLDTKVAGFSYVWVRLPVLSRASSLFAHWGNAELAYFPACATNGAMWSEGFIGVWHLAELAGPHRDASPARAASDLVQVTVECWENLAALPRASDIGLVSSDPWSAGVAHFKTSTNLQMNAQLNGAGTVNSAVNLLSVSNWFFAA